MNTRRTLLVSLLAVVFLLAVLAGAAAWLLNDEGFQKKQLSRLTAKYSGRELTLDGPLDIRFGLETTVHAENVAYGNAAWADRPQMARAGRLVFTLDISSLWNGPPDFSYIELQDCYFEVLKNADGVSNWKLSTGRKDKPANPAQKKGFLPFLFDNAKITDCRLFIDSPKRSKPLDIRIDDGRLGQAGEDRLESALYGDINGFELSSTGWLTPADAFSQPGEVGHELDFRAGEASLYSSGTVANIKTFSGLDLQGHFTGPDVTRLLDLFSLPPLSEGAFDFRAGFATLDGMVHIDIDGDLGTFQADADGVVDRLRNPREGQIEARASGPDLQALGQAFGVDNLVNVPFTIDSAYRFEEGVVLVDHARLETAGDRLALSGSVATRADRSGSRLTVDFESDELGRWGPAVGKPVQEFGAARLEGEATVDANGLLRIDARAENGRSELAARGTVGPLEGPAAPDLDFEFHSADMPRLAALAGFEDFPSGAFSAAGHARKEDQAVRLDSVVVTLDRSTATIDGFVALAEGYSGSDIEADIEIPDLGEFGALFALENWPGERLRVSGAARLDERTVRLRDVDVTTEDASARLNGDLVLAGDHSGTAIRADIDIRDLAEFGPLIGLRGWPAERLQASGTTRLEEGALVFRVADGSLGEMGMKLDGRIPDLERPTAFDTDFDISLPSLDTISAQLPNYELPPGSFEAQGRLARRDEGIDLGDARFRIGEIEGRIDGRFTPEKAFDFSLRVQGPDVTRLDGIVQIGLEPNPFSAEARLAGTAEEFTLEEMKLRSGESDLNGRLRVERGKQRRLSGTLYSQYINLNPWTAKEEQPADASPDEPARFVFDETPVVDYGAVGFDLDLRVAADRLDVAHAPYFDLDAHLVLREDRLQLSPFAVRGVLGGTMRGDLLLDNSGQAPLLDTQLSIADMKIEYGMLEGQDPETLPTASVELDLDGSGFTWREMASGLDGEIRLKMGPGVLSPTAYGFLLTDFTTQLFGAINPAFDAAQHTQVDCAVAAADIESGQVRLSPLVIHTNAATVLSEGHIDLRNEQIDMSLRSRARTGIGISASGFVDPFIKVGGTLADPSMILDTKGSVVQGGLAVATSGLSILGRSVGGRYLASNDPCGDALEEIEKRDGPSD